MTAIVEPETKPQADRNEAPASATTAPRVEVERQVVLAAHGLRKAFGGQTVLDGVDLELREREVILLRGDNGSGKTTLINILTGNLEPDAGTIHYLADGSPREFRFPRRWWQELNPFDHFTPESTAREGIGRMWQDVRLFSSQTLRDNIAVAEPRHLGENPIRAIFTPGRCSQQESEIARKADEMLARLGLAGRETSSGDKISLGQSKRVAIARAVAAGARILFLDEPLSGLDRQGIRDVLALLESIARDHAVTLVIVEHVFNHPHLHGLISSEWILDSGILRESQPDASLSASVGPKAAISERPSWFKLLLSEGDEIIDEPLPRGALLTRIRRATDAPASASAPLLEVGGLSVKRGVRSVIGEWDNGTGAALTFTLFRGEICILQAPNGWGKSTLLDAISGLIPSRSKFLRIEGASIANLKPWKIREAGLNYIPATRGLFPSLSVSQTAKLLGNQPPRSVNRDFSAKAVGDLSGGQLQAVKFSTTKQSCHPAKILCMDEPFNALDKQTTEALAGQLMQLPYDSILLAIPTASQAD